jgi:nitroreductase
MNLLHAAHTLGFAGTWLTGWAAYSAGGHRVLGITASEKVAGIVYIGTAKEMPADRKRPDIDAIVTRWISDDENATAGEPKQ